MIEKYNIGNNYGKVDKNFFKDKNLKPVDFEILVYIHSLHTNTKLTQKMISDTLPISKNTVEKSIKNLKKLGYLEIIETDLHEYKYVLKNPKAKKKTDAETKQGKKTDADAGTKQGKKTDADAVIKKLVNIEEIGKEYEENKKAKKFIELYKDICVECAEPPRELEEDAISEIISIMSKHKESDVKNILEYFNNYVKKYNLKYDNNFLHLVEKFNVYHKGRKNNKDQEEINNNIYINNVNTKSKNRFNNFKGREYTKEDFKELEKTFFN